MVITPTAGEKASRKGFSMRNLRKSTSVPPSLLSTNASIAFASTLCIWSPNEVESILNTPTKLDARISFSISECADRMLKPTGKSASDGSILSHHYDGSRVYTVKYFPHTINGDKMYFGNFIDEYGDLFDTVHFTQSIERYPFLGRGCYVIKGTVVEDFGVPSAEVTQMQPMEWAFNID